MKRTLIPLLVMVFAAAISGQQTSVPPPIVQGGQVVVLFPPGSPFLKAERVTEPEQNNMTNGVPGRIQSIVNIHNPSIEFHPADPGINTGAVVILAPGGGHNTLNVGSEGADFVPLFYNYGVNTVILRNRLRRDGYNPLTDEVYDAQQAIRVVRAKAREWKLDPNKIGIVGFSAGAELAAPAAVAFNEFDKANSNTDDPLAGISSRPDFVGLIYPGPTPFARDANTSIPRNAPPTFITCAGTDDAQHAVWADQYFAAMLKARIPNL
jgi:acetyl esterase/lipase